jgi:N-acetylglucosaminyl-diphospho-decaprenol L-rhamnosyltransferase
MMSMDKVRSRGHEDVDLAIIVVNWNTRELLKPCLDSATSAIEDLRGRIVVVDNGSTDGSIDLLRQAYPWVQVIENRDNVGFAAANNQALKLLDARHILLLNSDAVLLPNTAKSMVDFLDNNPKAAVVGGMLLHPNGRFQASFNDFPTFTSELVTLIGLDRILYRSTYPSYSEIASQHARRVDWVGGALMAVRRRAIEEVGLLDESFFMYAEEMDWCLRFHEVGWEVWYLPCARAVHQLAGSAGRVRERRRAQIYRSKWLFIRKHRGRLLGEIFLLAIRLVSLLKLLCWLALSRSRSVEQRERAREQVASYRYLLATI